MLKKPMSLLSEVEVSISRKVTSQNALRIGEEVSVASNVITAVPNRTVKEYLLVIRMPPMDIRIQ